MRRNPGILQASLCLLLVGASFLIVQAQENGYARYDPCAPPVLVNRVSALQRIPVRPSILLKAPVLID